VCLFLFDFEEGRPTEQEAEIAARVAAFKEMPHCPAYVKIIIVLIRQQHGEDEAHHLERFSRWSKRTPGLDGTRSFVFLSPIAMKLDLKKLEAMAFDSSQVVYTALAKAIKGHKHKVSKSSQQSLYVRHHFKIALFAEIINDLATAHKYYASSAVFLKQLMFNIRGGTATEIKAVADLLNYKLCRILIALRRINEAQEQFKAHVKYYQLIPGLADAQFLHQGWMALQYCTFADMVDAIPVTVLARSRQNNTGYLYETAAAYTFKRRNAARDANVQTSSFIADRSTFGPSVYFGQPLTKIGEDVKEKASDHAYLTSALTEEKGIDHSQLAIALLTRALEIFKREKASRMVLHIAAQMAVEHFNSKQFQVAKEYFDRIVRTYRVDMWYSILSSILRASSNCGSKLGASRDVVTNFLELLSRQPDDKITLFRQLQSVIAEDQSKASSSAPSVLTTAPFSCSILNCSVYFQANPVVEVKENVEIVLSIKSEFPVAVKFAQISVVLSMEAYNFTLVPNDDDWSKVGQLTSDAKAPEQVVSVPIGTKSPKVPADTLFYPNTTRTFRVNLQTFVTTLPQTSLQVSNLIFFFPTTPQASAPCLIFQCPCTTTVSEPTLPVPPIPVPVVDESFKSYVTLRGVESQKIYGETYWGKTVTVAEEPQALPRRNALDIAPAKPKAFFEVDQSGPALVDEYHCLVLRINSNGDCMRQASVKFEGALEMKSEANMSEEEVNAQAKVDRRYADFGLPEPDPKHMFFRYLEEKRVLVPVPGALSLPELEAHSTHQVPVYVCARARKPHVLIVTMTANYVNGPAHKEEANTEFVWCSCDMCCVCMCWERGG